MKNIKKHFLLPILFLGVAIGFNSCKDKTVQERTYMANVPVYMSKAKLDEAISSAPAKALTNPGKIHLKANYIFIVDKYKGVHVIDNSNRTAPQNVSYINVPGIVDLASKGTVLYADSYTDLLALDIENPLEIKLLSRVSDVFPSVLPLTDNNFPIAQIDEDKGMVIGWTVEEITEKTELENGYNHWIAIDSDVAFSSEGGGGNQSPAYLSNGKNGSMARFTVYENYMYTVHAEEMNVVNLTNTAKPTRGTSINTGRVVETIFPAENKLFLGTTTGMLIYDLSNASSPSYISAFNHINSCDPVVVQGDYAYVTLRSGNLCGETVDQLDVVNISDIQNPWLEKSYDMSNPHGLGIDGETLFICDGNDGLKVFNASDPKAITDNQIDHFKNIHSYDVIPSNGILLMIGEDGFYQYNYSDVGNISLMSVISIEK